jgi:hypothetical protein
VYPDGYDAGSTHPTYLQSFAGCHNGTLAEQRVPIITRDAFEDDSNSFPQFWPSPQWYPCVAIRYCAACIGCFRGLVWGLKTVVYKKMCSKADLTSHSGGWSNCVHSCHHQEGLESHGRKRPQLWLHSSERSMIIRTASTQDSLKIQTCNTLALWRKWYQDAPMQ